MGVDTDLQIRMNNFILHI